MAAIAHVIRTVASEINHLIKLIIDKKNIYSTFLEYYIPKYTRTGIAFNWQEI